MRVLFVCSGNICRSPMAERLFRDAVERAGADWILAESAGTLRLVGRPAAREAIAALDEVGLDLSDHRSSALGELELASADLVIAMAREHLPALDGASTHFLLRAFEEGPRPAEGKVPDLDDPIGKPLETFREQLPLIRRSCKHLLRYLEHTWRER